ncbi:MAG: Fe-S cluster assembly ATPase SufC [Chloroflexota bacterium]
MAEAISLPGNTTNTTALDLNSTLVVEDLHASVEGKEILKGINLQVTKGQVHALMGPNGSGKSTLANVLMGHPKYEVTRGRILFKGQDVLQLSPDERAKLGIFLAFQYPISVSGVSVANFLRASMKAVRGDETPVREFRKQLRGQMQLLKVDDSFVTRYLNEGFSGGEKKKNEILQMALLRPEIAILDETDSGLDIDALRTVSEGVNALLGPEMGVLIITHYQRILNYIKPDVVHILVNGRVARTGGPELVDQLEAEGYDPIISEVEQNGHQSV